MPAGTGKHYWSSHLAKVISGLAYRVGVRALSALVAVPAAFALLLLVRTRPLPVLCASVSAAVLTAAGACCILPLGVPTTRKVLHGAKRLLAFVIAPIVLSLFLLPYFAFACLHGRYDASQKMASNLAWGYYQGTPEDHSDLYGGEHHLVRHADAYCLIWSDGPDQKNDGGRKQIGYELLWRFERTFEPCHVWPLSWFQRSLRRSALWELRAIWGHFQGDIVWVYSRDKGIRLRPKEADGI